jgi:hypothetical protein
MLTANDKQTTAPSILKEVNLAKKNNIANSVQQLPFKCKIPLEAPVLYCPIILKHLICIVQSCWST